MRLKTGDIEKKSSPSRTDESNRCEKKLMIRGEIKPTREEKD
jgi:hypothetical protein